MRSTIAEKVKVLLFHRVSPVRDPLWDPMSPELFRKVISYISKKYEIFFVEELKTIDYSKVKKPIAAITFDDGYRDYLEYAIPILNEFKTKSSLYVVTDCIDRNEPTWTYYTDYYFKNTNKYQLDLADFSGELGALAQQKFNNKLEFIEFGKVLKQYLKKVNNDKREQILDCVKNTLNDVEPPNKMMLSWQEISQFDHSSICIGSHTKSHPPLATIDDEGELLNELTHSYNRIHQQLGFYPQAISYPVGSYNVKVMEAAIRAGYKLGLAVDFRVYNPDTDNDFSIPRLELYNENYYKSILRAEGIYYKVKSILGK